MTGDDIGRLIYLGSFLLLIGGGFLLTNRLKLSQTLQMAAIWVLIFLGAVGIVGMWDDIKDSLLSQQTRFDDQGTVTIPRSPNGHYYMTLRINDEAVDFVVDTGATDIVLNQADAQTVGLDPDTLSYFGRAMTANGEVRTAQVRLDSVVIGPHTDINVPAIVNQGALDQSLLGMGYLQRWGRIAIENGEMTLSR